MKRWIPRIAAAAGGSPALIANSTKSGSASTATTPGVNTTGANLIVLLVSYYIGGSGLTISDSYGNTSWTALTNQASAVNAGRMYYCYNPTVGASHTFTAGGSSIFVAISMQAWSNMAASPFDQQNGANYSAASLATGSITPSQANTLVVTGCTFDNNSGGAVSITSPSGYTITDTNAYNSGVAEGSSFAYKLLTAATAQDVTWNITNSTTRTSLIANFKY